MVVDPDKVSLATADWHVYRIISARYPHIDLFERVAAPGDWELLYEIESLTNPRLRDEVGEIRLVPAQDRVYGPGASWIMAAFTHRPAAGQGGRFNRDFGVYYCAPQEATAVAETSYHRAKFLRESRIEREAFEMRVIRAYLGPTQLLDIRSLDAPPLYDPDDYTHSQTFGRAVRQRGRVGIFYRSVRCDGECAAVMRPAVLTNAVHLKYLKYRYADGRIISVKAMA